MPRAVLYNDDGSERLAFDVSERNVALFMRLAVELEGPLRVLAVGRELVAAIFAAPAPRPLPPVPPRRKKVRALYTPPRKATRS